MAINIVVSDKVRFKVEGSINDPSGVAIPFDFSLTCDRLATTDEVQIYLHDMQASDSKEPITDKLLGKVRNWSGVKGEDGADVPFSEDAFRALMRMPGLAYIVHMRYLREVGAKEKN